MLTGVKNTERDQGMVAAARPGGGRLRRQRELVAVEHEDEVRQRVEVAAVLVDRRQDLRRGAARSASCKKKKRARHICRN